MRFSFCWVLAKSVFSIQLLESLRFLVLFMLLGITTVFFCMYLAVGGVSDVSVCLCCCCWHCFSRALEAVGVLRTAVACSLALGYSFICCLILLLATLANILTVVFRYFFEFFQSISAVVCVTSSTDFTAVISWKANLWTEYKLKISLIILYP